MMHGRTPLASDGELSLSNGGDSTYPRLIALTIVASFALLALGAWWLTAAMEGTATGGNLVALRDAYRSHVPAGVRTAIWLVRTILLNPFMYLGVAAVFWLEHRIPAARTQPLFGPGLRQDLVWFVADNVTFRMLGLPLLLAGLDVLAVRYVPWMRVRDSSPWPLWLRIPFWLLVVDFTYWASHVARHKIPFLWQFHAVHHAVTELTVFSDFRQHFVDRMTPPVLVFAVLRLLGLDFPPAAYVAVILDWHSRIVHSNLRTNFGILRFVLVSPQYHRVHHSIERQHTDVNLGSWFTFWDRIFGTIVADYDVYPTTGILDTAFPLERDMGWRAGVRTYFRQTAYPFRVLAGRARRRAITSDDAAAPRA